MKLTSELLKALGFKYDKEDHIWYTDKDSFTPDDLKGISLKKFIDVLLKEEYEQGQKDLSEEIHRFLPY